MSKKNILVMFGGISPEHEVSVITGLQVIEKIDKNKFEVFPIYVEKDGNLSYFKDLNSRKDFNNGRSGEVYFGRDNNGGYIRTSGIVSKKIYLDAAYLAFHGGNGENGEFQGMLTALGIPISSPNQESSVITMNKVLTKLVLKESDIPVVEGLGVYSSDCLTNIDDEAEKILNNINLPLIIKPAHLGSSIGINIAKTEVELKKYLLEAAHVDSEILVESLVEDFVEYNCSVRLVDGDAVLSEIEKPAGKDEILSFADKYKRGQKKSGDSAGMASLSRELPASISKELANEIREISRKAYKVCRCDGLVRIDFMYSNGDLYLTEINSIPGSVSYYLWEASGVPFTEQITQSIHEAISVYDKRSEKVLDYKSDIIEKFINS